MTAPVNACIGLGANIGHPRTAVQNALKALAELPDSRLVAASRLYRTAAWGRVDQPDYVNAAALVQTQLTPQALLRQLQDIERNGGRRTEHETASQRWGPCVLDLDLLLYGERTVNEPGLRVPHPWLHARAFALVPLAEIAPDAPFPGHGSVMEALRQIEVQGVEAMTDS
ncbi:MAG: 2-amino-4-hydroxy-6-hydroxymethyldihydropteridine diphosphokinase [Proteobacteria bacterium]|nr:2-amino-4-hydroxy-6-hydroxymethyldihydropteridine diphosphokinase [Pseudomonadota bacterium]